MDHSSVCARLALTTRLLLEYGWSSGLIVEVRMVAAELQ